MEDPRDHMEHISDLLKASTVRRHIQEKQLPEVEIPALFVNDRDGPQFFTGERGRAQPLYLTPVRHGQSPVAWMAKEYGGLITQDCSLYRRGIKWIPLYLAR